MNPPALRIMTPDQLAAVRDAALRVLDTVGMVIEHEPALDVLEAAGARIDRAASRVYFPPELVTRTIAQIPRQYTYHGRTPEFDFTVTADGDIGARNTGGCTDWIDPTSGEHRRAGIADWRSFCTLVDALPNVRALANMHCGDVPGRVGDIHSLQAVLEAQRKCSVHGAATLESWRLQLEMLLAVRGTREALAARPLIHHMCVPISPLFLTGDDAAQIMLACEYGIPIDVPVMSIVGMTSPITIAGTLVQDLAEELGTATLIQATQPGHPMAFFMDPVVANMRSMEALCATPEAALLFAGICQIGTELFGVPTETIGLYSDGFSAAQTMFHKGQSLMSAVLAGGKMMVGAGCVESIIALSPVQLVIDDELMSIARRWLRGFAVDEEALAVEAIARVGPKGDYLADEHTVRGLRGGELLDLPLSEREGRRPMWEAAGKPTIESRARDKALSLLATHAVPPLPDDVLREIATIVRTADTELAGG